MKVLVTGSTGFLGSWLVDVLREKNYEVVATDIPGSNFSHNINRGCKVIPLDLAIEDVDPLFKEQPEIVFHVAGVFHLNAPPSLLRAVNVKGVEKMCSASLKYGVKKFVLVSTVGVYGKPAVIPCKEEDPKNPRNNYELTKWLGECVAVDFYEKKNLPLIVVRPTLIYGPRSRYGHAMFMCLVASLYLRGRKKIRIMIKGGPRAHSVHVEDVARATLHVTERNEIGKVFNVADETPVTLEEFFSAFLAPYEMEIGRRIRYMPNLLKGLLKFAKKILPLFEDRLRELTWKDWKELASKFSFNPILLPQLDIGWIDYVGWDHVYDITKLKGTGYKFKYPDFKKGIEETMKWYMEEKWLPSPIKPMYLGGKNGNRKTI
jgi:nucleoside-diphosphate-sugar epimerase